MKQQDKQKPKTNSAANMTEPLRRQLSRLKISLVVVAAAAVFVFIASLLPQAHMAPEAAVPTITAGATAASIASHASATAPRQTEPHKEDTKDTSPTEKTIAPRAVKYKLEGDAAAAVTATNAYGVLTQAVGAVEDKGYTVAFVIHDMTNGNELTYNSTQELYPASSIKGPFTTNIYQEQVETGTVSLKQVTPIAEPTILESSDEGYREEHRQFGTQTFIKWLKDAGVGPGSYGSYEAMVTWNYPHISAQQLALMWIHAYKYLMTKTEPAKELADLFERREVSSLRKALDPSLVTWSKMGWFDSFSEYNSEPATVEAGVVFSEDGPYVLSVMTTAPALLDELIPIHRALYRAHQDML